MKIIKFDINSSKWAKTNLQFIVFMKSCKLKTELIRSRYWIVTKCVPNCELFIFHILSSKNEIQYCVISITSFSLCRWAIIFDSIQLQLVLITFHLFYSDVVIWWITNNGTYKRCYCFISLYIAFFSFLQRIASV